MLWYKKLFLKDYFVSLITSEFHKRKKVPERWKISTNVEKFISVLGGFNFISCSASESYKSLGCSI